jgi:hypothetical protein
VNRLAWRLAFADGWGRAALLAGCTAVVSGLLLVAVAVLSLPANPSESLFGVIADTGTRGGYVFGTVLLTVPALLLLHQVVRLGTSARERRLASLRLAGATPADVRRIGALEVGAPALVGAVGGIAVYGLLRILLGGGLSYRENWGPRGDGSTVMSLRLVPSSVTPTWWQVIAVVVAVTVLGICVGLAAGRGVVVTPLGVSRRTNRRPPRPWGALLVLAEVALGLAYVLLYSSVSGGVDVVAPFVAIALLVVGTVSLTPWSAYVVGRAVAVRAGTPFVLLAARRLAADPRPAGRAAAAVGGIGLVAGGGAAVLADLLTGSQVDRFYFIALALTAVALVVALAAVVGSLTVHSVESLMDHRRSVAALGALGAPTELLIQAQRYETGLVALPMGAGATLFGAIAVGAPMSSGASGYWFWLLVCTCLILSATILLVWVAIRAAVRLTRPWTLRAINPTNLRTE